MRKLIALLSLIATPALADDMLKDIAGQMSGKYRLSTQDPQNNPKNEADWCWGIENRLDHLNRYRAELLGAAHKLRVGSTSSWRITQTGDGQTAEAREDWLVKELTASGDATVEVTVRAKDGAALRTEVRFVSGKVFDELKFDARNPMSCGDAFMFAHDYGTETRLVAGSQQKLLYRVQANLGGAIVRDGATAAVPFGKAYEERITMAGTPSEVREVRTLIEAKF
jgi:hypothetical protein